MTSNTRPQAVELLLDSNRGIYIPQAFIANLEGWEGITQEDREIIESGPEHEWYWEAWDVTLNNATWTQDGNTWRLHQDGDLFALCYELMTDEEKYSFGFDD